MLKYPYGVIIMAKTREDKLLDIFTLGLQTDNKKLKIEIINFITTENLRRALPILSSYLEHEDEMSMRYYLGEALRYMIEANEPVDITTNRPPEDEITLIMDVRKELALRLDSIKE